MTQTEYMQQIEDALLAQRKRGMASAKEASKVIDDLGMRHLLVPMKQTSKKSAAPQTVPKNTTAKKKAAR
jgi:hypothetical protein